MLLTFRTAFLFCLLLTYSASFASWLSAIEQVGRTHLSEQGSIQSDWPHTGIHFQLTATENSTTIEISFVDCSGSCHSYVAIEINCERVGKFEVNADNLMVHQSLVTTPGKTYDVVVRKITETLCGDAFGILEWSGVNVLGGYLLELKNLQQICERKFRLIVFGDSYTAGYGVDELSPCSFTAATEDVTHAYAAIVAKELSSDVHVVAWSGKGVVRNYGDVNQLSSDPLPFYYNRTLGGIATVDINTNYWDPTSYQADLVIVMLGTNDYSTLPFPTDEQFISGLVNFVHQIEADYSIAKVLLLCAPGALSEQCSNIEAAAKQTSVNYFAIPNSVWSGGYGCSDHPFAVTQQNMAEAIRPTVQLLLGL